MLLDDDFDQAERDLDEVGSLFSDLRDAVTQDDVPDIHKLTNDVRRQLIKFDAALHRYVTGR